MRVHSRTEEPGLLEREGELLVLEQVLSSPAAGDGKLILVEGAAGIGKTALLEHVATLARRRGLSVLRARAAELEMDFAYGVVRQLLEPSYRCAEAGELAELLAGAAQPAQLVLGAVAQHADEAAARDPSFGVLHGLYWFTANLAARSPLAMVVDDVHWCDPPSLRFMVHLARRLEGVPVALVLAVRSHEPTTAGELLEQLRGTPGADSIAPAPLTAAAVERLVSQDLPTGARHDLAAACHRATGGNPFYVRQLIRTLANDGLDQPGAVDVEAVSPETIRSYVIGRLTRLGPDALTLARAMAVLGEAPLERAARLAQLEEPRAADLAELLHQADLLTSVEPFAFIHAIVRAAILAETPHQALDALHLDAARQLGEEERPVEEVAGHLHAVAPADREWVVQTLRAAANSAVAAGAPEVAVRHFRRALAEPPPEVLPGRCPTRASHRRGDARGRILCGALTRRS